MKIKLVSVAATLTVVIAHSNLNDPRFNDRTWLPPINVRNAVESALKDHPLSVVARESVELSEHALGSARSDLGPVMNATYSYSHTRNPANLGVGDTDIATAGVTLSQPLFSPGSFLAFQAAKKRLEAAVANSKNDSVRVASRAIHTYFEVVRLRIALDLAKENSIYLKDLVDEVSSGELKKWAKPMDLSQAQAAWGTAGVEKHEMIPAAETSEVNFERDAKLSAKEFFLSEPTPLVIPREMDFAIAQAIQQNPGMEASRKGVEASRKDVRAAKGAFFPRVDAFAAYHNVQRPVGDFKALFSRGASAGVNVTVPLYDGKRISNLGIQRSRQRIAEQQLLDQSSNLVATVKTAYVQITDRSRKLNNLCLSLQNRMATVEAMRDFCKQ